MIKSISISQFVSQGEGNIVSDMDGEKVMLSIHNGKYYNLGELGGEIWEKIKEPVSIQNLVDKLVAEYDVELDTCKEQVISFLALLLDEGLVKVEGEKAS
ncbi:lasso peptide biosynthesis PqqD family chaperone [Priestia aryabhattai]|uniref:lasso peptide biosynthesis PqqD family chaperone n=1 Tax=Priestia TaxID=2800373 RepID=UPI0014557B3D|nr:lasso peptide biosynthesis PqqD family chaperone [Priestia aryabhattai]NLR43301.1 lasso peptide biosynthesis PqqD family chaperone [Priestia megaterium]MBY0007032.1 lasso peptide biosynthesis PqqD family chaperone [Priestia aryabhattai]MBY0048536.1 lasso peptide biosynthesis PqqD family chaperone [Priestia aryabhattai]MED3951904.1 lasso peptide biosynthesis PqqD family chaperone [Priestia aryabhattai]MED4393080.1 lasso peptide biosynthesis PqqD family chaperone [Priestia aryabhattai]